MTITKMLVDKINISQKIYFNIFEHSQDAIIIFEPRNGLILNCNRMACLEFELKKSELIGKPFFNLFRKSEVLKDYLNKFLADVDVPVNELELKNVKEATKFFEVKFLKTNNNDIEEIVAVARNITDKKITDKKLSILTEALRQSSVAILLTDQFKIIEYANCKFLELREKSLSEIIGHPAYELDITNFKEVQNIWQNINLEKGWAGEIMSLNRDGSKYYATLSISPIKDHKGNISHYLAIEQDITKQKNLESQLILALSELRNKNDFKTNLLGNLNHEIRTPMNSIIGFSQIIGEETEDINVKEMSNKIIKAGQRLLNTLSSIIELSDLESEKAKVNNTNINLSHLIRSLSYSYSRVAGEKKLTLNTEILKENIIIYTDEGLLEQILKNLIENAIKFTEKGSIRIVADQISDVEGKACVIKVIDTGIGIPEKNLSKIFDAFKQLSEGTTRKFEGTGLGLTIVQKAAKLINARLNIESEIEKGSVFSIIIPIPESIAENNNDFNESSKKKARLSENSELVPYILIVEDDLMNIDVMKYFLDEFAIMDNAINSEQALKAVQQNQYDLILMDINLKGGIDGIELMKMIREMPEYKNTPIVATSGYTSSDDQERFLKEGFTQFLAKPFNRKQITEIILEVLK